MPEAIIEFDYEDDEWIMNHELNMLGRLLEKRYKNFKRDKMTLHWWVEQINEKRYKITFRGYLLPVVYMVFWWRNWRRDKEKAAQYLLESS